MPLKLADLENETVDLTLTYPTGDLHVKYKPAYYSSAIAKQQREIELKDGWVAGSNFLFLEAIKAWDLTGDDKKVIPLTLEGLEPVKVAVTSKIFQDCRSKASVGEQTPSS